MTAPQIDNGSYGPVLHVSQILPLPPDSPWGNLSLKSLKIVQRIIFLNIKLISAYSNFDKQKGPEGYFVDQCALETEEIIYWIRKTVDEFIQILYVAMHFRAEGTYPKKIDIDSIGTLLKNKKSPLFDLFSDHHAKLQQLNDAANAYKHSFLNSDHNLIGRDEPVVFMLSVPYNDLSHEVVFGSIALKDFVRHFDQLNQFFRQKALELLKPLQ